MPKTSGFKAWFDPFPLVIIPKPIFLTKRIIQSQYIKGKINLNRCYIFGEFSIFATYQRFLLNVQYIQ